MVSIQYYHKNRDKGRKNITYLFYNNADSYILYRISANKRRHYYCYIAVIPFITYLDDRIQFIEQIEHALHNVKYEVYNSHSYKIDAGIIDWYPSRQAIEAHLLKNGIDNKDDIIDKCEKLQKLIKEHGSEEYRRVVDYMKHLEDKNGNKDLKLDLAGGKKDETVDHPSHYNTGNIEVIEAIDDWQLGFCLGNALKYIARAGHKDPDKRIEDLQKAVWYLNHEIERSNNHGK